MAVNRRAVMQLHLIVGAAARQLQVAIPRRDVGMARQHALAVLRFFHRDLAQLVQPLGERTGETGRHVLGDQQRRTGGRQRLQHLADRFGAAGGSADGDQFFTAQQRRVAEDRRRRAVGTLRQARPGGGADLLGNQLAVSQHAFANAELRFGHEVHRAQLQRAQRDFRAFAGQRRDHHHRHRPQAHQLLEEIQPVHARHLDVQRQHLGIKFFDQIARHQRIRRGRHHLHVGVAVHDFRHQLAHQCRIVYA
ncbi:Uncharacterised protein [Serratia marcescens]|nr:Uncharacterised protein [Serratia marcescens]